MKKSLLWIVVLLLSIAMVAVFSLAGCKAKAVAEEEAAPAEEEAEEVAEEEEAVEEEKTYEPMTLEIWDWQNMENFKSAMLEIFDLYNKTYPEMNLTFDHKIIASQDYTPAIKAAAVGGTLPALFQLHAGSELFEMAKEGILYDFTDAFNKDKDWITELNGSLDTPMIKYNNGIYQLPVDKWIVPMWYYKDILNSTGLAEPKTIDDFIKIGEKLKDTDIIPIASGFTGSSCLYFAYDNLVYQQTDDMEILQKAETGEVSFKDPIFKNALVAFKKMVDEGVFRKDVVSIAYTTEGLQEFKDKKGLAFWYSGDWYIGEMNKEDVEKDNLGFLNFPLIDENAKPTLFASIGLGYSIPANSPDIDRILHFARFLTSEEATRIFIKWDRHPATVIPSDIEIENPLFKKQLEFGNTTRIANPWYTIAEVQKAVNDNVAAVLIGTLSVDEALDNMDKAVVKE